MPSSKTTTESPAALQARRLQWTIQASSWWLMGQGALNLCLSPLMSVYLNLRFHHSMTPYINQAGWALLGLGLFINRAVREASRQYLAVDSLVLFFCGMAWSTLHFKLTAGDPFPFEWFTLLVNLSLVTALILLRTRGKHMQPEGSLVSLDALQSAKEALRSVRGLSAKRPPAASKAEAPLPMVAEAEKALTEAPAAPPPPPEPKAKSTAMPHLD